MVVCSVVVALMGTFTGCRTPAAEEPAADGPVIDGPGRFSFESLGWTEDALITSNSNNAQVRFVLPDGVVQGDPLWYGARIAYEWTGSPGAAGSGGKLGDRADLMGLWNGYGFYGLGLKPLSDLDGGYKWTMVDMVNGGIHGYEITPTFAAASTNFAMYKAVRPGWNQVSMHSVFSDASDRDMNAIEDFKVIVKKDSEIVVTSWRRPSFEGKAVAEVEDDAIRLKVEGENQGWGSPGLTVRAEIFREDGSIGTHSWNQGPLEPLGAVKFEQTIPNEHESPVVSVVTWLDWGSGQRPYLAWPEESGPSWYTHGIFRSAIGAMIALVVVWVGGPMLFRAVREARRG